MQYSEKYPFDYSPRGGTIDELGASYVDEIKRIYAIINELRENREGTQEPQPFQLMVSDQGKVYFRAKDNMSWVYMGEVKENFGLNQLGFVTKEDIGLDDSGNINGNANKMANAVIDAENVQGNQVLVYDATYNKWVNKTVALVDEQTGVIQGSVSGGANSIANFPIKTENIQDGEILVYRPSLGGFVNETKAAGIGAKEISFVVNGVSLASYSGTATTNVGMIAVGPTEPDGVDYTKPPVWIKTE